MHHPKPTDPQFAPTNLVEVISEQEQKRHDRRQQYSLNKARDDFIAISSHQLRTPATVVKQYLAMIIDGYAGEVPEYLKQFLKIAYDNNEKQLALLTTFLQVAEIDAGNFEMNPSVQDACELIQDAINTCDGMLALRNQRITNHHPDACRLVADPEKIKIVLINLIDNACKNSPAGSDITITLRQTKRYTRIRVRDRGPGIPKDNIRQIFQKFTHIENEHVDTVNGNGLGLYIARKITKKLGGALTVSSRPMAGSTFTLTFKSESTT